MIEPVATVAGVGSESLSSRTVVENLQDHFMTLLLTELRYQDPTDPMKDREFFTQLAQFTQVEETVALRDAMESTLELLNAQGKTSLFLGVSNLVGRECAWVTEEGECRGVVDGVGFEGGSVYLTSGGRKVPFVAVTWIGGGTDDRTN